MTTNTHSESDILELLRGVLSDIVETWKDSEGSRLSSNEEIGRIIESAFSSVLIRLTGSSIDMIAVQLFRSFSSVIADKPQLPLITVRLGQLTQFLDQDYYYNESYPFLEWDYGVHLRVCISGNGDIPSTLPSDTFVTTLSAIKSAKKEFPDDLNAQVDRMLTQIKNRPILPIDALRKAAMVVLRSTEYTRRLMDKKFLQANNEDNLQKLEALRLPHRDQRNLLFVPVLIGNEAIGGAAFYSHYTLPDSTVAVLDTIVHLLLCRIRAGDDITAARLALSDKARWEATLMYVHRLAHDVRKPAYQAQLSLQQLLRENEKNLPESVTSTLKSLDRQLTDLKDLISTRAGTSVDEMRSRARADAQRDYLSQLLEDSIWVWELEAQKRRKKIHTEVVPTSEEMVRVPRFLVVEVLGNIISNAIRFARRNVWVTAEHCRIQKPPTVRFTVRDDGRGMEKSREQVSTPYYTTESTYSGLGLRLSQFIVEELLGGELLVQSSPRGVSVTFTVPEIIDDQYTSSDSL